MKKPKQTAIPKKVIEMAKFIQECDQNKREPVIIQKRNWGKNAAIRLARNNN